jgi:20S proteasome alpha/beta subunit
LSEFFLERMRRELFVLFVQARSEKAQQELDEEVERITGKECDDAARALSKEDFRRVAEEAMRNIRKRRQRTSDEKSTVEVSAYR